MIKIKYLLGSMLSLLFGSLFAQNNTSSPYSVFGVGQMAQRGDVVTSSMGHAGVAVRPSSWLNTLNPASYSALDSTAFYFNMQVEGYQSAIERDDQAHNCFNGNISAFSMGFKASRNWGIGLGYMPYSSVGYSIQGEKYLLGTLSTYPVLYEGSGGLSQIYWANSVKLFKGFSVGVNLSYLWGNLKVTESSTFPSLTTDAIFNERTYYMHNFYFEYGFQYGFNIKKHKIGIGAVANAQTRLTSNYQQKVFNDYSSNIYSEESEAKDFSVPMSYSVGLSWDTPNGFLLAGDYSYQNWTALDNPKSESAVYVDNHRFSFGVEYGAKKNTYKSYLLRMKYRAGLFFNSGYLEIKSNRLTDKGLTAGLTFPLGNRGNLLNLGYEYLLDGTRKQGLLEETRHTFRLGLTINEMWFVKRRFD